MSRTVFTYANRADPLVWPAHLLLYLRKRFINHGFDKNGEPSKGAYKKSAAGYEPNAKTMEKFGISKLENSVFELNGFLSENAKTVVFLAGGAFWHEPSDFHWAFMRRLKDATGCRMISAVYPKAPTFHWPDAYTYVMKLYDSLLETTSSNNVIFMGDSAGASIALSVAQLLRDSCKPLPKRLVLLSPAVDLSYDNPEIERMKQLDSMLDFDTVREMTRVYAGDTPLSSPELSAIVSGADGLCELDIFTGTWELFYPDIKKLCINSGSTEIKLYEYPKMPHTFPLFSFLKEARDAQAKICGMIV